MVRAVPRVSDLTKGRLTDDWPAKDSVPVTVKLAYITKPSVFDAVPVRVRVPKVAPEAYSRGSLAPVKLTILYVRGPVYTVELLPLPVMLIVEVLALKVGFVVANAQTPSILLPVILIIEFPKVIVLALELLDTNCTQL